MDEDETRLALHSQDPKIILHGSGNSYVSLSIQVFPCTVCYAQKIKLFLKAFFFI